MAYATAIDANRSLDYDLRMYDIAPDKDIGSQIKTGPLFLVGVVAAIYGLVAAPDAWWMAPYAFGLAAIAFALGMQFERWHGESIQDKALDEVWTAYNVEDGKWERVDV